MSKHPSQQQQHARDLRRNSTDAERWFWKRLRNRQLLGHKFRRQVPIGPYIVDFICLELRLVIEVDGSQHRRQDDYDESRTQFLGTQGYRVLRYWNNEVLQQGEAVLESIVQALLAPHPNPSPRRGEGLETD